MATRDTAPKETQSKLDQIVQDFFLKSVQIILQSRMPLNGKSASTQSSSKEGAQDRRFNLALGDCSAATDGLEVCTANGFRSIVVDVHLVHARQQQAETGVSSGLKQGKLNRMWRSTNSKQEYYKRILERWVLRYMHDDEERSVRKRTSEAGEVPVVYKSTMILLRSLCCLTRLLPAHRLLQLANHSSYGNYFGLSYSVSPLARPLLHDESIQMTSYKFTPIEVSSGKICISVDFRSIMASDLRAPSEIRLPSIMTDYIGSSTTDPVKKFFDHGSTSLMLNFGGRLPLTVIIPPSLPHQDCKVENFNCHTCNAPKFGHFYPQGHMQKAPSCRKSDGRINFSPKDYFHCDAQLARQRTNIVGSVSGSKARDTVSGACNNDWNETDLDDFYFPFAVDDSKTEKFCNSSAMGNQEALFQISRDAAIGALVQLLEFAPPLQQLTTSIKSYDFSNPPKSSTQENSDGNLCIYFKKPETFDLLKKDQIFPMSCSEQDEATSSYSKKTAAQALRELGSYKDIKQWLLDEGRTKAAWN